MIRDLNLGEETDGKRYTASDMVRLGCRGCAGCSECCRDRGSVIPLDPYDICMLTGYLKKSFDELLDEGKIRLAQADHLILPCLPMKEGKDECFFLNREGRCDIHAARPSICRLFPLARLYEGNSFSYILQVNECPNADGSKVKISRWLEIPSLKQYENWIILYHGILRQVDEIMGESTADMKQKINLGFLNLFFRKPYAEDRDFYQQFEERRNEMR